MKVLLILIVAINLLACAAGLSSDFSQTEQKAAAQKQFAATERPIKSPHGYVIDKDYEPGRFGGFVGDCTDDKNWPYFWQCMSENAGNGGFE